MFEAAERAAAGDLTYFESERKAELGFLVWARDEDGRTLLHLAAANGHLQLLETLVAAGASKVLNKSDDEVGAGWRRGGRGRGCAGCCRVCRLSMHACVGGSRAAPRRARQLAPPLLNPLPRLHLAFGCLQRTSSI
jgi:hypothetical protein